MGLFSMFCDRFYLVYLLTCNSADMSIESQRSN